MTVTMNALRNDSVRNLLAATGLSVLMSAAVLAKENPKNKPERCVQVNLVSDQPGIAVLQDTNLVTAWRVSFSPMSPSSVSDNGTGKAKLYAVISDSSG